MLFYRKKRIYYRISDVKDGLVFSVDQGNKRFFLSFSSVNEFETWYAVLPPGERTLNEIVRSDFRKLVLDIDSPSQKLREFLNLYDFEKHVTSRIRDVFDLLQIGQPEVVVYDMCSNDKLSYHAVVSNFAFSAPTCIGLCSIVSSRQVWEDCVDAGVYKTLQSFRIEGSTKFGENRWKRRTFEGTPQPIDDIETGLLSCIERTTISNFTCQVIKPKSFASGSENSEDYNLIPDCFKIRKICHCTNTVFLRRIKPGFCNQCNRVHFKENAMIKSGGTFVCWRKHFSAF